MQTKTQNFALRGNLISAILRQILCDFFDSPDFVRFFWNNRADSCDKNFYDAQLLEHNGTTWENMMMAANLELENLICFLDHNGSQSFGHTKDTHPKFYPIKEKIISFGWECVEINGHSYQESLDAVKNRKTKKPFMIIGNTIKEKGVSFMENKPIWHYRSPNPDEYKIAMRELDTNKK